MTTIKTKLVKDGNSVAIRLPKTVLTMSGLIDDVQMEVKRGQVILRPARTPRSNWKEHIAAIVASNPNATKIDPELEDWEVTIQDGVVKGY